MKWDDTKIIACDLEASGRLPEFALQPWRVGCGDAWITSASMIRRLPEGLEPHVSQLFPTKEQLKRMLLDAVENDWIVLGWNIAYDISMLKALGQDMEDLCMQVRWLDGMLIERHYDIEPEYEFQTAKHKKKSYALKGTAEKPGAMQRWLPHVPAYNEGIDFHSTDPDDLARLQKYNDRDNVYTWVITSMIWEKLTDPQRRAVMIEAEALPMVAQANLHGIPIDYLTTRHLSAKLDLDAARLLGELAPHGVTEQVVRSPMKLAALMFDDADKGGWQLPVLKVNKSKTEGKPDTRSTDKEVLHELSFVDERAKKVKEYRETLNAKGKFCAAVLDSVAYNDNSCTHPVAKIFATYTGRMTVSSKQGKGKEERPIGFALHQMKRGKEFREILVAPEGYDIVEFDAAGQEFRWMAIASGDPTMLGLCMPGEDAHTFMGAQIVAMDYQEMLRLVKAEDKTAGQNRYLGKFANLSLQYRTSARKLRSKARVDYDIPIEIDEARRIHATYQRAYPGVPHYWDTQIALVKAQGYVETFGGNRVRVVGDWNGGWGWSMGSTAINCRIQGTGADQKHLAMAVIKHDLHQMGGRFLFDLHDGLYLVLPKDIRPKAVDKLKPMLDNLPYREAWGFTPPIPMPWDCKVGKAWGQLKEQKFS